MKSWSDHILKYYLGLQPPSPLPDKVQWLHPQKEKKVRTVMEAFYGRYYNDDNERLIMLGINPGRYGAGVTGVNFTAPRQLKECCGIDHEFKDQSELSAEFIYKMIQAFGGVEAFFGKVFIGSVCPLGLVKDGKNINYYDDKDLAGFLEPFITQTITGLVKGRSYNRTCISIGGEKNYKFIVRVNEKYNWFDKILALPHPRFIMQYRRKAVEDYVKEYVSLINLSIR